MRLQTFSEACLLSPLLNIHIAPCGLSCLAAGKVPSSMKPGEQAASTKPKMTKQIDLIQFLLLVFIF